MNQGEDDRQWRLTARLVIVAAFLAGIAFALLVRRYAGTGLQIVE